MRHMLISCLLLGCAGAANAQLELPEPLPLPDLDQDLMQGGPAWLVGDHVKARRHFLAAAQRGHPLGQYNLAMMLLYREGGPCDVSQAMALLQKSADAGNGLAHEALAQVQDRGTARKVLKHPFACPLPRQAPSTSTLGPVHPAMAR